MSPIFSMVPLRIRASSVSTKMVQIFVDADATVETGFGHVSRCLNLVSAVQEVDPKASAVFGGCYDDMAIHRITQMGYATVERQPLANEMTLLDRYDLEQPDVDIRRERSQTFVVIDDFGKLNLKSADCVINFRVGAELKYSYGSQRDLLGVGYFPAPKGLKGVRDSVSFGRGSHATNRVLIFMGGGASADIERAVVELVADESPTAEIRLISRHHTSVNTIERFLPQSSIVEHLQWADSLLCGGGLIKYEAGYAGRAVACFNLTEEQARDTEILAGLDLVFDLGTHKRGSIEAVRSRLRSFFKPETLDSLVGSCLKTYDRGSPDRVGSALAEVFS